MFQVLYIPSPAFYQQFIGVDFLFASCPPVFPVKALNLK